MKILVACEESQVVTKEFRSRGHEAWSCDILDCSGGRPEWHIKDDVTKYLDGWDMIIAFPPCTHLSCSGARWFPQKIKDGRQQQGIDFFMRFVESDCPKIAIENPIGVMSTKYRKPDQIVQPYEFGDPSRKSTCLWLKGLPKLTPTNVVKPDLYVCKNGKTFSRDYMVALSAGEKRGHLRSKTYPGIAKAMASQYGERTNGGVVGEMEQMHLNG